MKHSLNDFILSQVTMLEEKYGKMTLSIDDIKASTGLGRDNVYAMFQNNTLPSFCGVKQCKVSTIKYAY